MPQVLEALPSLVSAQVVKIAVHPAT